MERYNYEKLYWDLLESWSDLKIKHGCAVEEAEQLRKQLEEVRLERDELARAIIKIHEDQEGDYDFLKFISHPQYILAKKVNE